MDQIAEISQNIFVYESSPNWCIKLGDFGVSKRARNDKTAMSTLIFSPYAAPEVREMNADENEEEDGELSYTNAVNMWSCGMVVHWLLTRKLPFTAIYCQEFRFLQGWKDPDADAPFGRAPMF